MTQIVHAVLRLQPKVGEKCGVDPGTGLPDVRARHAVPGGGVDYVESSRSRGTKLGF